MKRINRLIDRFDSALDRAHVAKKDGTTNPAPTLYIGSGENDPVFYKEFWQKISDLIIHFREKYSLTLDTDVLSVKMIGGPALMTNVSLTRQKLSEIHPSFWFLKKYPEVFKLYLVPRDKPRIPWHFGYIDNTDAAYFEMAHSELSDTPHWIGHSASYKKYLPVLFDLLVKSYEAELVHSNSDDKKEEFSLGSRIIDNELKMKIFKQIPLTTKILRSLGLYDDNSDKVVNQVAQYQEITGLELTHWAVGQQDVFSDHDKNVLMPTQHQQ